jgi:hypothetical protein
MVKLFGHFGASYQLHLQGKKKVQKMPNPVGLLDVGCASVTTLRMVTNSLAVNTTLQPEELNCQQHRWKNFKLSTSVTYLSDFGLKSHQWGSTHN